MAKHTVEWGKPQKHTLCVMFLHTYAGIWDIKSGALGF